MAKIELQVNKQLCGVTGKEGYYTRAKRYSRISAREVVEYAAQNSGINPGQLMAAMYALEQSFQNFLCNGHSVEFAELGTFRISVQATMAETPDQAGTAAVHSRRILYLPSVKLKSIVNNIKLEQAGSAEEE